MNYNVCLMGASFETGNKGVSALAASLIKNIIENKSNAEIHFLIGNKTNVIRNFNISGRQLHIKVVNYRLSPKANIKEHLFWIFFLSLLQSVIPIRKVRKRIIQSNIWLRTINEAHFIGSIHGGDSFSDIYGLRRFLIEIIPDLIVLLIGKKLVLLPQTYGPYKSIIAKFTAIFIMCHSSIVFSRDKVDTDVLMKVINRTKNSEKVQSCPDIAFTLDPVKLKDPNIVPPLDQNLDVPLIGLNINGLMYNGGYTRNNMFGLKLDYKSLAYKLAVNILEKTNAHIIFIPHTFGDKGNINSDPDACNDVLHSLPESYKYRTHLVMQEYDQSELKGIIGHCDFFIGSRMHACIAALSQGIPTVGIAYSGKFKGVFESIGVSDAIIDCRIFEADAVVNKVLLYFYNRMEMKKNLYKKIEFAKNQITSIFAKNLI